MDSYFFISDAHLGSHQPETERRLTDFLLSLKGRAKGLYILGDLFEFWFEYQRVIPKSGLKVLAVLNELHSAGTRVVFLKGNHDVWFRGVLSQELGIEGFYDHLTEEIEGKRVFMTHGDLLDRNCIPKFFRGLMRNRLNGMLFSLLHPDIGIGIARYIARKSREQKAKPDVVKVMRGFARRRIAEGCEVVVMGHSHIPERIEFGRGVYINVGDWLNHFTYCRLAEGKVFLERYV